MVGDGREVIVENKFDPKVAGDILLEVAHILDRYEMPFFLLLGTCLGVVRDDAIIPYDKDIDLGVLFEDLRYKATELSDAFEAVGYHVSIRYWPLTEARAIQLNKDGIHVDIAGLMKHGNDRISPSSRLDYALVYPANVIENTNEVEFLGRTFRVPSGLYLQYQYGKDWKTPNLNWKPKDSPARNRGYLSVQRSASPIVCTIGCFDLLHVGHVDFLTEAKSHGCSLAVGTPNDRLYYQLKGKAPIHNEHHRREMLKALRMVNEAYVLSSFNYVNWVRDMKGEVVVLSVDHVAERFAEIEKLNGCSVIRLSRSPRDSSFEIINRCRQQGEG